MTLQEAIEEVKRTHSSCDFEPKDITDGWRILSERAIATILNAVVKGQLAPVVKSDSRPEGCRFRLQDEGKPYPRSSCQACGKGIMTGLGKACGKDQTNDR